MYVSCFKISNQCLDQFKKQTPTLCAMNFESVSELDGGQVVVRFSMDLDDRQEVFIPMKFPLCHVECQRSMTVEEFKSGFIQSWFTESFHIEYQNAEQFNGSFIRFTISAFAKKSNLCSKANAFLEQILQQHDEKYVPNHTLLKKKLEGYPMLYNNYVYFDQYIPCQFSIAADQVPLITLQTFTKMFNQCSKIMSARQMTSPELMISPINFLSFSEDIDYFIRAHETYAVVQWFATDYKVQGKDDEIAFYSLYYASDVFLPANRHWMKGGVIYGDENSNKLQALLCHHNQATEKTIVFIDNCFYHDIRHRLYHFQDKIQFVMDTPDIKHMGNGASIYVVNVRIYKRSKRLQTAVKAIDWHRSIICSKLIDHILPDSNIRWYIYKWFDLNDVHRVFRGFELDDIWTLTYYNTCRRYFGVPILRFLCFRTTSNQRMMVPKLLYSSHTTDAAFYKLILSRQFASVQGGARVLDKIIDLLCRHSCGIHDLNCIEFDQYEHLYNLQEICGKFKDNSKYHKFPLYNEMKLAKTLPWCDEKTVEQLKSNTCFVCMDERKDMIFNEVCKHTLCLNCARISYIKSVQCSICRKRLKPNYYRLYENESDKQAYNLHIQSDYARHVAEQCRTIIHGKTMLITHYKPLIQAYKDIVESSMQQDIYVIGENLSKKKLSQYEERVQNSPIILTSYENCEIFAQSSIFRKVIVLDMNMKITTFDSLSTIANGFMNASKYFICKSNSYVASVLFYRKHFIHSHPSLIRDHQPSSMYLPKHKLMFSLRLYKEYIKSFSLQDDFNMP